MNGKDFIEVGGIGCGASTLWLKNDLAYCGCVDKYSGSSLDSCVFRKETGSRRRQSGPREMSRGSLHLTSEQRGWFAD